MVAVESLQGAKECGVVAHAAADTKLLFDLQQETCERTRPKSFVSADDMDVDEKRSWLRDERERLGWSPAELAKRAQPFADAEGYQVKFNQQLVWNFENTAKKVPGWYRFAVAAIETADGKRIQAPAIAPDQPQARTADGGETVEIIRLDLSLPMGSGATVDDYVEEEPVTFDLGYIRAFTRTPPHRLRIARGVGDSMTPTLLPYDLVWIDSTQTELNQADKVWAVSINGAAAIKRLRRLKGNRVLVISDNPVIDNYEVDADEIRIGGRVIRFARDL